MNIIITNKSIRVNKKYFKPNYDKIHNSDIKNILYTFQYKSFKKYNWIILFYEEYNSLIDIIEKYEKINIIYFFRANQFIKDNIMLIEKMNIIKKIIYIDDLINSNEITNLIKIKDNIFNNFNLIVSTYKYHFKNIYNYVSDDKIYWMPHSFNEEFKIKYNNEPKNKLLLTGYIDENIYPIRKKIYDLKINNEYEIDILEHPSYRIKNKHDLIGKNYITKLNKYRFGFTCCLNKETPYIVQKFFEIPGSGSLLIAYDKFIKNELNKLGFKEDINYISIDETNYKEKLDFIYNENNYEILEKIRYNGYKLINKNHNHYQRINEFMLYLKSIKYI